MLALLWSNSPWSHSYESVWTTNLSIHLGGASISADLRHWVNEGLMTFFFLVVGLEAKREFDMGELRERRRIAVPVLAALGGMAVPVAIYLLFNAGGAGAHGWGAAMSTDTAFALGALALFTPGTATRLRVFLLTLAVVDDLGALIVIATAYTKHVSLPALFVAIGLFGVLLLLRFLPAGRRQASVIVGIALWVAMFKSGIDPVIAGLAAGLATSAFSPARRGSRARDGADALVSRAADARARALGAAGRAFGDLAERTPAVRPASMDELRDRAAVRAGQRRHPRDRLVARRRDQLADHARHHPRLRRRQADRHRRRLVDRHAAARCTAPRPPISWPLIVGGGAVAGIGFTVSLLISGLAFTGEHLAEAKLGVLGAAILAPLVAWAVFSFVKRLPSSVRARQISGTAEDLIDLAEDVDPTRDHIRGPDDAVVTLVEYGDFECPFCGQAEPVVRELLASFGDDLRYVWRHLPLNDVHGSAQLAAEAVEAAAAQGSFWEMYDAFLAHQDALTPRDIDRIAQRTEPRHRPLLVGDCAATSTRRASPRTSPAPMRAASRERRRSSSTAAAIRAPTTSPR